MKDRNLILHRLCDLGKFANDTAKLADCGLIAFDLLDKEISVQVGVSTFRAIFPDYNAEAHNTSFRWSVNVLVDGVITIHCACSDLKEVYEEE